LARTTPVKKATRALIWLLVIIAALALANAGQALISGGPKAILAGSTWTPKLALDLEGGTEIILEPQVAKGHAAPTADQLNQAVAIIRQRIDASGVSEAEISTQGSQNVVVDIPGIPDQATIQRIESSAELDFRAVICATSDTAPTAACTPPTATPSPSPSASDAATPTPSPSASASTPSTKGANGSSDDWITPAALKTYGSSTCKQLANSGVNVAPADKALVTCDTTGVKYILGPVEVAGSTISDATSGIVTNSQGISTGQWAVNIVFNSKGTTEFAAVTKRLNATTGVKNQFAIVLDGSVISAPTTNAVITNGKPQITGNFTQESATTLADQLKFGALPIGFKVQSNNTITATLGTTQLQSGLLAGLIGLILVVLYSLLQYRSLASITIASLVVAATITFGVVLFLSGREGFRLSLAGVAGLIVAIGITADSFIVYFERIRDELRDGRPLESAVEAGWKRAIRTILASDTVNFLAAAILYIVAVGSVKGFALTLGLTTLVDLVVVTLFTHPMLRIIAQRPFFAEGHRFSGLDPKALGAVYRGRATFRTPGAAAARKAGAAGEAQRRQTIAERKAAELNASSAPKVAPSSSKNGAGKNGKGKDS
jgi:preprotein translocase subunit SecD